MKTKVVLSKKEREGEKKMKKLQKGVDQGKQENGTLDNCPAHPIAKL